MSNSPLVDRTADTVQFRRIGGQPHSGSGASSLCNVQDPSAVGPSSVGHGSTRRIVFKEKSGPDLWLIAAIVAILVGSALFVGGLVVSQIRDTAPAYESVYIPANVLGMAPN